MKTKFVRILSVLLAIAMLAACSVIVSATGSGLDSKLGLAGVYDKNEKIVKITLVSKGEVCYNVEGVWGEVVDENNSEVSGITLDNILWDGTAVDTLSDMYSGNTSFGSIVWVDIGFNNPADPDEAIVVAEFAVDDTVEAGTYTFQFLVDVYTGKDMTPVEPTGELISVDVVIEEEPDEPQGTLKGDVDLDGVVGTLEDFTMLARHYMGYEYIDNEQSLANGDINGDESIGLDDLNSLARYYMGYDDTLE